MARGKTFAIIVGGCAGVGLVMIAVCAGLLYYGYQTAETTVSPRIDALFSAIEDGTFADTYETEMSQELRDAVSKKEYTALGDAIAAKLGKLKSKSLQGFNMAQHNADSLMNVSYRANFEHGQATINAILQKEGNDWKFASFEVNSPLLVADADAAKCPACGEPVTADARFCPSCGAEIGADGTDESPPPETSTDKSATAPGD